MSTTTVETLVTRLEDNSLRKRFASHEFFRRVQSAPIRKEQVEVFLGQWWHPLHYFPTFLARCVAALPDIESKSAISRILNQETGGGKAARAHEVIYGDTMERAGFSRDQVTGSAPFPQTERLVAGYERAAAERLSALGFIFATEVSDLMMVSGIGTAVERVTGVRDLEWVRIHVEQEPDHVEEANHATTRAFLPEEEDLILAHAEEMWSLWIAFFDKLEEEFEYSPSPASRPIAESAAPAM